MNPTNNPQTSYYYRQLATAFKDSLPNGTTGKDVETAVSACSIANGFGFGFGISSLFFSEPKTAKTAFSLKRFSSIRPLPFFSKLFLSFGAAFIIKNEADTLLQRKSVQTRIREINHDQERDYWSTLRYPSGEEIKIGLKDYKQYENDLLHKIMGSHTFDVLINDPRYLQKKEQLVDRIEQTCKGVISSGSILKKFNEDNQPSRGLCLGFSMNWVQYLFQNGLESVLTRDRYAFEKQDTSIDTILFHKINDITCSGMDSPHILRILSSILRIPQEKISYIALNSSQTRSNKITEANIYFLLKQHEGKIVCLTASHKTSGHAICAGSLPEKDLYFMISNNHLFFFSNLESLCRGIMGIQEELCKNTRLDDLVVVDPSPATSSTENENKSNPS